MQLRLQPRFKKNSIVVRFALKTILFVSIFLLAIFLLDKVDMPSPNKFIKQEISNDKLITLK